jgi:hypothetical protein
MAGPEKFDWRAAYLTQAESARERAKRSSDPEFKELWLGIAVQWDNLAKLRGERCVCGALAIGVKYYPDGTKIPYCSTHLSRVVTQEALIRIGLEKPN